MASMTRADLFKIIKRLKSVYTYQNFIADDDATEAWYMALCSYPLEHINAAIQNYVNDNDKPPCPSDIRAYLKAFGEARKAPAQDKLVGWLVVENRKPEDRFDNLIETEVYADSDKDSGWVANWLKIRGISLDGRILMPKERYGAWYAEVSR